MAWATNLVTIMKLTTKISVTLMCLVSIAGLLIGMLCVEATTKSFDQYIYDLREVQLGKWGEIYLKYYVNNGNSWTGVDYYTQIPSVYDPFLYFTTSTSVVLSDEKGVVLYHPENQYIGRRLNSDMIRRGYALKVEGEVVGFIYPTDYFNPRFWTLEEQFAQTVAKAAIKGIFFISAFAILFGVALSRGITIPLKSLNKAAMRMAKGNFDKPLPVYSDDEIGELSQAFNSMAHEINEGNKLRQQMFADISHELRTPLTVLSSKLEMSLDKNRPLDPVEVSALYDEVIRLNGLVGELQDLSKLEAGQIRIEKTPVDFRNFFNDFFVLIQAEAESRHITLQLNIDEALQYVYADPQRLKQIVLNLVNNAMRYTPDGGNVVLRAYEKDEWFVFEVEDDGIGISSEDLPYIFQRFYRAEKSRDRATGGSGLGLAITKGYVEAHGGTIEVQSTLGKGTMFIVHLPRYIAPDDDVNIA